MPYPRLKPNPDFTRLTTVLEGGEPDRVPFVELLLDEEVIVSIREQPFSPDPAQRWRQMADLYLHLGFDYLAPGLYLGLRYDTIAAANTAPSAAGPRHWSNENEGVIGSWADFERYPWPKPESIDYSPIEHAAAVLPEGMRLIGWGPNGPMETVLRFVGLAPLAYLLSDDPDLIAAVFSRVGELALSAYRNLAGHPAVGAIWCGDDMGFKTQTIVSPDVLRRHVLPWHRLFAEAAHAHGKPYILHSCGKLDAIMDDLIDAGVDARHSFEDAIRPIEAEKCLYGDRLALLGGIDMDILARGTPNDVRRRVRRVLDACMPGGGFALGSGNTVSNYIPLENYFAMLEEGWQCGGYR